MLLVVLVAGAAGCAGGAAPAVTPPAVTPPAVTPAAVTTPAVSPPAVAPALSGHGQSGRRPGSQVPVGWPSVVPLPQGTVVSSGTGAQRWSMLLEVAGPADAVLRAAAASYVSRGWTGDATTGLHSGPYELALTAAARDHSAATSLLTVVLTGP